MIKKNCDNFNQCKRESTIKLCMLTNSCWSVYKQEMCSSCSQCEKLIRPDLTSLGLVQYHNLIRVIICCCWNLFQMNWFSADKVNGYRFVLLHPFVRWISELRIRIRYYHSGSGSDPETINIIDHWRTTFILSTWNHDRRCSVRILYAVYSVAKL